MCKPGDPEHLTAVLGLNINACQTELGAFDLLPSDDGPIEAERFTGYLVNHASDLTKLIKYIV